MKIRITFTGEEQETVLKAVNLIRKNFPHLRMREPEPVDGKGVIYFSETSR